MRHLDLGFAKCRLSELGPDLGDGLVIEPLANLVVDIGERHFQLLGQHLAECGLATATVADQNNAHENHREEVRSLQT